MKRLIVNADDFGLTTDVNEGIVEACRNGILTATTVMANGAAFAHAVELAKENPSLDIGCHLVLVGGESVLHGGAALPAGVPELLVAVAAGRIRVYDEMVAQVTRVLEAGITPSHLDTHKHTHLAPPVLDAVARISQEFRIRWVRRPFDFPITALRDAIPRIKRATSDAAGFMRRRFEKVLARHGCRMTDYFAGFQITGRFRTREIVQVLQALPDGLTEFMCHPGFCREELRAARTRLKESREWELEALTAPEARAAVEESRIELVRYRDL